MSGARPSAVLARLYSASAREYAALWAPVIQPMGERLVAAMPLTGASVVVDLGSGTGALYPVLHAATPGSTVIGVDRAIGMLLQARESAQAVPLATMDLAELGFRASSVDAAVLAFVLFHVPDPLRGLGEVRRVLRPRGIVGLAVWGPRRELPGASIWTCQLDEHGAAADVKPEAVKRETLMDTPEKLRALLDAAGFALSRIWIEILERRWTRPELLRLGSEYGAEKRRLDTLNSVHRAACMARISEEFAALPSDALVYRGEVILAIARRAEPPQLR
jgi:SAM-dependent methyltransferase